MIGLTVGLSLATLVIGALILIVWREKRKFNKIMGKGGLPPQLTFSRQAPPPWGFRQQQQGAFMHPWSPGAVYQGVSRGKVKYVDSGGTNATGNVAGFHTPLNREVPVANTYEIGSGEGPRELDARSPGRI